MTCSPPFRRVTGLPEDIPRRPRQRRWMKAIGVWARLHAEACSTASKVTAKTGRRNNRVYGPLWKSDRKRETSKRPECCPRRRPSVNSGNAD
jgi:hypothetical protein